MLFPLCKTHFLPLIFWSTISDIPVFNLKATSSKRPSRLSISQGPGRKQVSYVKWAKMMIKGLYTKVWTGFRDTNRR